MNVKLWNCENVKIWKYENGKILKSLGVCILVQIFIFSHCAEGATVVVDNRLTSLEVAGVTELTGAGGVILASLSIPTDARLVFDPIATPIMVSATPVFAKGVRLALSSDYTGMTLGRVVLMTYPGEAIVPAGLFDASSVAGDATLTQEVSPDGTNRQLVLTVGDYANAPEIRVLAIGDSITHGLVKSINGYNQQAQYRTAIAARLAANGYRPIMLGHLKLDASGSAKTCDAAGVQQPDEWIWHSGVSGDRIMSSTISGTSGGVRDNLHIYLDVAGKPDAITLLIGTNDLGSGMEAAETFVAFTNIVWEIARQSPGTKIIASTILERTNNATGAVGKVAPFNKLLLANLANLPANCAVTNLYPVVPQSVSGNYFDGLHPTMKGYAPISKGFAAKIMEVLPRALYSGPIDDTLTDEPQTALGAAATVPAAYRDGMTHVFTLDAASAANVFYGVAPYTATNAAVALSQRLKRAGYYMELVRAGTNRRRYVWVDFNADRKTLDEIDFPWTGGKFHQVVNDLHVFSNDGGIRNISADVFGYRGVVEATSGNYSRDDNQISGVPVDLLSGGKFGWNDTLTESGPGYGCFQVHRIFSQTGDDRHWNNAEVLFAWNRWGSDLGVDEIGIGMFANHANNNAMDYTYTSSDNEASAKNGVAETISAVAYQVRHLEIWVEPFELDETKGEWIVESAATSEWTGEWSSAVEYGVYGRAYLGGEVAFTPNAASTGNVVTVEAKAQFNEDIEYRTPDMSAQAAVRLSTNGCFQVWVGGAQSSATADAQERVPPAWVDVEAEGIQPVSGEEYTLRTTLDYTAGTYGVEVKTGSTEFRRFGERANSVNPVNPVKTNFPLAFSTNCVTSFAFVGDTYFTSLVGDCRYEAIGFRPGEITVADANVILDAAKAAWLNARGDYAAVSNKLATVTSNEFATAWLCNLDIMNADASAKLSITRIDVSSDSVAVGVTLERTGAVAQKINGELKFYGATALAAFREGTAAPLASTTLVDDHFSEGDTATATFSKDTNTFFKAEIGEK